MKKLCLCLSVCAFAFWACGDDSSSGASAPSDEYVALSSEATAESSSSESAAESSSEKSETPQSSSENSETAKSSAEETPNSSATEPVPQSFATTELEAGEFALVCKDDALTAKAPATIKASFYKEDGQDMLVIEGLSGPCIKSAPYSMSRSGDTLLVELGKDIDLTNCVCISDHVYKVNQEDTDAKFVKYVENESAYFFDYSQYVDRVFTIEETSVSDGGASSSSVQPAAMASTNEYGFAIGKCGGNEADLNQLAKRPMFALEDLTDLTADESELPKAQILTDGNGKFQVYLPQASDYCEIVAKVKMAREGDALKIDYVFDENTMATKCRCLSDHWFDIDAEYADVKYITFGGTEFVVAQ